MSETRKQDGGMVTVGTKRMVFNGTAKRTSGGLTKKDLMKTRKGRIVSKKKHAAGKRAIKTLRKMGYIAKKGKFSLFKKGKTVKRGGSQAMVKDAFKLL